MKDVRIGGRKTDNNIPPFIIAEPGMIQSGDYPIASSAWVWV